MGFLNIEPLHVFLIRVVLNLLRAVTQITTPKPPPPPPPSPPTANLKVLFGRESLRHCRYATVLGMSIKHVF